jgi:hypothetical protein
MRFFSIFKNPFKKSINNVAVVPTTHHSITNIPKIVPANIISDSSLSITEAHQVEYKEDNNISMRETYPVASPLLIPSEEFVISSTQIENNNNQENNNQENNNQENNNEDNRGRDFRANLFAMIFVLTWFLIAS